MKTVLALFRPGETLSTETHILILFQCFSRLLDAQHDTSTAWVYSVSSSSYWLYEDLWTAAAAEDKAPVASLLATCPWKRTLDSRPSWKTPFTTVSPPTLTQPACRFPPQFLSNIFSKIKICNRKQPVSYFGNSHVASCHSICHEGLLAACPFLATSATGTLSQC